MRSDWPAENKFSLFSQKSGSVLKVIEVGARKKVKTPAAVIH